MPTTTANGIVVPVSTDAYALTTDLKKLAESARLVIPVANATERASAIAALVAASIGPSSSRPIYFDRADIPGDCKLERTTDGATFVRVAGADTGWVAQTMAAGWTSNSTLYVRRIANRVIWRGDIRNDGGTIAAGEYVGVCNISPYFRPTYDVQFAPQQWVNGNPGAFTAGLDVRASDGRVTIRVNSNSTGVRVATVNYLTD